MDMEWESAPVNEKKKKEREKKKTKGLKNEQLTSTSSPQAVVQFTVPSCAAESSKKCSPSQGCGYYCTCHPKDCSTD